MDSSASVEPRNIVISGAGPAGVLSAIHLLRRNENSDSPVRYRVTLIDPGQDYGALSPEELGKNRSWMLGLASHGLEAIRSVPGLYEDYVQKIGVQLQSLSIHLGAKEIKSKNDPDGEAGEGYIVDRNFVVAALARYLNDHFAEDVSFVPRYKTRVLYVDGENHRILVRNSSTATSSEEYLDYDLLIGCDGVRSVVREAIVKRHRDFEFDVGDIFQKFKAVHVQRPDAVDPGSMHILPACFRDFNGIALPETGDMLNVSIGTPRHTFDASPAELRSTDPNVVSAYLRDTFKPWDFVDCDDFARQWCAQSWSQTGQVHCNFYHSSPLRVVIMGDAAHATSPSIGMGMNTALADAVCLTHTLMDEHGDDLNEVLPAFSKERVKIGNSLTDLAMHLNCLSPRHQLVETAHMIVRGVLSKFLPSLVTPHPMGIIGVPKYKLSEVYEIASKLGIVQKHRGINDRIRRTYFENEVGMVKTSGESRFYSKLLVVSSIMVSVAAGYFYY